MKMTPEQFTTLIDMTDARLAYAVRDANGMLEDPKSRRDEFLKVRDATRTAFEAFVGPPEPPAPNPAPPDQFWHPLDEMPSKEWQGRYILGHRGYSVVTHYLHPHIHWRSNTKIGWQVDPASFGATHWAYLPELK